MTKEAPVKTKTLSYDDFLDSSEDSKDPIPKKVFVAKVPEKTSPKRLTSRRASQPKPESQKSQSSSDESEKPEEPAEPEKPETRRRSTRIRKPVIEPKKDSDSEEEIVKESKPRKAKNGLKISPKVSPKAKSKITKKSKPVEIPEKIVKRPVERRKRKKKNLKKSEPKKPKIDFKLDTSG